MVLFSNGGETTMCSVGTSSLPLTRSQEEAQSCFILFSAASNDHSKKGPGVGRCMNGVFSRRGLWTDLQTLGRGGLNLKKQEEPTWPGCVPCWAGALSRPATAAPGTAATRCPAQHSSGTRDRERAGWTRAGILTGAHI